MRRRQVLPGAEPVPDRGETDYSHSAGQGDEQEPRTDSSSSEPQAVNTNQAMWSNRQTIVIFSLCIMVMCLCYNLRPTDQISQNGCPGQTIKDILTPIEGSKHLMMSAYKDHREGGATRIIAVINRRHPTALDCVFCCSGNGTQVKEGGVQMHGVHYGRPYEAASVLCSEEPGCSATHVRLSTHQDDGPIKEGPFLPIQNKERREENFPTFLTVCMSTVFGDYNNALQFVQTMEVYKLLGVKKVVLYLTSCGRDFSRVLQHYVEEGVLEIIPWRLEGIEGDIYLNGQLSVMNECIYRNMYTSQYVLLADVNQLLVPYKHSSLRTLVEELQGQHPEASVFQVETHVFPLIAATPDAASQLSGPEGREVPGVDLLKHVYREPIEEDDFRSHKMIVNPRLVVRTAMFEVLNYYGKTVNVPSDVCKIMQIKERKGENTANADLVHDRRLWDFADRLTTEVSQTIERAGYNVTTPFAIKG